MPGRGPSPRIDWKKAERLYRQGLLFNVEIARQCNATESSIRSKAKEKGWTKDLTHDMRTKARIKMVENLAQYADPNKVLDGMHDEQITEEAARTQVNVVREHQQTLKQGHGLTVRMLNELDATTAYMGELQQLITSTVAPMRQEALRRAVSLGQRATIMRDLATAARLWVQMERQAFSIVDESKNPEVKDLDNKSAEELRAEIMDDAKKMGLDISDLGVAKSGDKVH